MLDFNCLPAFPGCFADETVYPAGRGIAGDGDSRADNCLRVAYNVPQRDFEGWLGETVKTLKVNPSIKYDRGGTYCEFLFEGESLYCVYIRHSRQMYAVIDRGGVSATALNEETTAEGSAKPLCVQYGLFYGKMIPMVTSDCGMCYFVRTRDNRLIMVDGGEIEQCTAPAMKDMLALMHRLTGTENGGKIVIAAWLCTHAHNDHIDLFAKLIKEHADETELQRVVFNFPSDSVIRYDDHVPLLKERIKEYHPGAVFLNIHTGAEFTVGGIKIEALLTHEDILPMKIHRPYDGMNGTTAVYRISSENGSFIVLGDLQDEGALELAARYGKEKLSCGFIQAAHHCINSVEDIYSAADSVRVLIPQSESDCKTRNFENYSVITRYNDEENCFFAGNGTDIFSLEEPSGPPEHLPQAGIPYDGSEY